MRSLKEVYSYRCLYGNKFRYFDKGTNAFDYQIYTITKIPDVLKGRFSDKDYCWVGWETGGTEYGWSSVIRNMEDGIWVKI